MDAPVFRKRLLSADRLRGAERALLQAAEAAGPRRQGRRGRSSLRRAQPEKAAPAAVKPAEKLCRDGAARMTGAVRAEAPQRSDAEPEPAAKCACGG